MRAMSDLGLDDRIEDIVITLDTQVHLIRPIGHADGDGLFVHVALDRSASNLVIARRDLHTIEDVLLAIGSKGISRAAPRRSVKCICGCAVDTGGRSSAMPLAGDAIANLGDVGHSQVLSTVADK